MQVIRFQVGDKVYFERIAAGEDFLTAQDRFISRSIQGDAQVEVFEAGDSDCEDHMLEQTFQANKAAFLAVIQG